MFAEFPAIPQWFLIGTWGFPLLVLAYFAITLFTVHKRSGIGATISLVVFILALQFMAGLNLIQLITGNLLWVLPIVALLVVFDVCWMFFRLRLYAHERTDLLNDLEAEWLGDKGRTLDDDTSVTEFKRWANEQARYRREDRNDWSEQPITEKLKIAKNKARSLFWLCYAVMDAIYFFGFEAVKKFGIWIWRKCGAAMQAMTDKIYDSKIKNKNILD